MPMLIEKSPNFDFFNAFNAIFPVSVLRAVRCFALWVEPTARAWYGGRATHTHRIAQGWKKFFTMKHILCNKAYPLKQRTQLFTSTVAPTVLVAAAAGSCAQVGSACLGTMAILGGPCGSEASWWGDSGFQEA